MNFISETAIKTNKNGQSACEMKTMKVKFTTALDYYQSRRQSSFVFDEKILKNTCYNIMLSVLINKLQIAWLKRFLDIKSQLINESFF